MIDSVGEGALIELDGDDTGNLTHSDGDGSVGEAPDGDDSVGEGPDRAGWVGEDSDTSHPSAVLAGDDGPPAGGPSPEELKSSRRAAGGSGEDRTLAEYAERLAGLLANAGFPRMPARVLMALMVADVEGLTASDLAQRLDVSAAAISNAVRYLQSVGMIRRVSQPGRRRDRYELPHHAWYTASLDRNPFYDAGIALSEHVAVDDGPEPSRSRKDHRDDRLLPVHPAPHAGVDRRMAGAATGLTAIHTSGASIGWPRPVGS